MICRNDIERAYIKLYSRLRDYIWDYDFLECLAKLEDSTFDRFPDMGRLRYLAGKLHGMCRETMDGDADLEDAVTAFRDLVESNDCGYSPIHINIYDEQ